MATRPFAFGARFKDGDRTVRVYPKSVSPQRYITEVSKRGKQTKTREHTSLPGALQTFAQAWRSRLN
ncbi:hypothetical protein MK489_02615 [Myxococcota bacterium]|nr:hypothetical protein [Myxococcota bacterium]